MTKTETQLAEQKLTPKEETFIKELFANGFNATRAAIVVGYEESAARIAGHRLVTNVNIRRAIENYLADVGLTRERILKELAEIALKTDLADYEPLIQGGSLDKLRKDGVDTRQIKRLKVSRRAKVEGEGVEGYEDVTIELHDRAAMLVNLAKMLGAPLPAGGINVNSDGGPVQVNVGPAAPIDMTKNVAKDLTERMGEDE